MYTPRREAVTPRRSLRSASTARGLRTAKASRIFSQSDFYCLEALDLLPAAAQEVLVDVRHGSATASCKFTESGHCVVVSKGRLALWHISQKPHSVRTLTLPDDLSTANHVEISSRNAFTGLLMSSLDGKIHYVADVVRSTKATCVTELNMESGDRTVLVVALKADMFFVGTMLGYVYVVRLDFQGHSVGIESEKLQVNSQGMIAGLGRRVSSFLFGGGTPSQEIHSSLGERVQAISCLKDIDGDGAHTVFVLGETKIQSWKINNTENKMVSDFSTASIAQNLFSADSDKNVQQLTALDMVISCNRLFVLLSTLTELNERISCLVGLDESMEVLSVEMLDSNQLHAGETEPNHLSAFNDDVIAHGSHIIWIPSGFSKPADSLKIAPSDVIFGAGFCQEKMFLLTKNHSIVCLNERESPMPLKLATPFSAKKPKPIRLRADFLEQLREAFVLYCQKEDNKTNVMTIASDLHSAVERAGPTMSSVLDAAVISLSLEIIDDAPHSDPRWAEASSSVLSSSSAVIIFEHLRSKIQVHDLFLQFLSDAGFLPHLRVVGVDDRRLPTVFALCEHQEKVVAAIELRKKHNEHVELIDSLLDRVLDEHVNLSQHSSVTAVDLFYKNVSSVHLVASWIFDEQRNRLNTRLAPEEASVLIETACSIQKVMIDGALAHREAKAGQLGLGALPPTLTAELKALGPRFAFWTDIEVDGSIRDTLTKQLMLLIEYRQAFADSESIYYWTLAGLADVVLTSYMQQIELYKKIDFDDPFVDQLRKKFSQGKQMTIMPIVDHGLDDLAASLAEKYREFAVLMRLFADDKQRLCNYAEQYEDEGFVDFMFQWYIDEGFIDKLLDVPDEFCARLTDFLDSNSYPQLASLHHIRTRSFDRAHDVLSGLATEKDTVSEKKTLLSIAKIALFASDKEVDERDEKLDYIDSQLDVILHQENLPDDVKERASLNLDSAPPLNPLQLIDLYTKEEVNPSAGELDFRKAQDLVGYLDSDKCDVTQVIFSIWSRALLRDKTFWTSTDAPEPLELIRQTVFYRICKLASLHGLDLQSYVPPLERILHTEEMEESGMADNEKFLYLVRVMYDDLGMTTTTTDDED
ncbi:nuclear pore complex protein Nup133-like [Oscarella lobularis]|uniref:nuclear pore complex protein Nup133-like n=1 Tax=Oscarella lobularis TaxID=121494 RepID=UPI0033143E19